MSVEEHDNQLVKGHVVQANKRYKRAMDEERELKELVEQRQALENKVEEEEENQEQLDALDPEESTFKKRYGDLRRHSQEKERQFQKQLDDLKGQLESATKKEMKLPKTDADIEAWAKDYPDVAKIVETIAMKKAREQSAELETRIQKIDEMSAEAQKEKAEAELQLHNYVRCSLLVGKITGNNIKYSTTNSNNRNSVKSTQPRQIEQGDHGII